MRTGAGPLRQLAGANWLWWPLPPDSQLERSRSLCRLAPVPTGLEISGLFADWPQCPLAWRPQAAPGHDRAWFYPRCSLGLDTSRRKSTRPNWDTWLEVIRGLFATSRAEHGPAAEYPGDSDQDGPSLPTGLSAHWPGDPGPLPDMTVPGFTHGVVRASTLFDGSQHAHIGTHG